MMADKRPPHSFAQKFVHGGILSQFWSTIVMGLGLANSFLILTALSVYQFGLYQLILAAMLIADSLSTGIFDEVVRNDVSRAMSENKKPEAKRLFIEFAFIKIGLGFLVTAIFFFGADVVARFYDKDIGSFIRIISFIMVIRAGRSAAEIFLKSIVSLRAFGAGAIEELAKLALISGFFFFFVLGIREVLFASVAAALAAFLFVAVIFAREYRVFFMGISAARQLMFRNILKLYGFWIFARYAVAKGTKNIQPWLVRIFLNTEAVALYSFAYNLLVLIQSLFPAMKDLLAWEAGNQKRLRFIFARSMKYSLWGGALLGAAGVVFIPPLIGIIFPKYIPAMPVFKVFLLTMPLFAIARVEQSFLVALREQKIITARLLFAIVNTVVVLPVFLPLIGIFAVALAMGLGFIWRVAFFYYHLVKKYPFLKLRAKIFIQFDPEDRIIFWRAMREARSFVIERYRGLFFAQK